MMARDRPAFEIEITEEMIKAGLAEFRAYDRRFVSDEEAVKAIYLAMEETRRVIPSTS
jgi:hypothetical protein